VSEHPGATWRKPAGIIGIILFMIVWVVVVASFSETLGTLPVLVQLPIYLVLGIVWIFPLKPVLRWMETGRWR